MKKYLMILTMLFSLTLVAELPPYVYEELQKNAPESLLIKVKDIEINSSSLIDLNVKVIVEVLEVLHSKSDLQENDKITIVYRTFTSRPKGWVGPSPIPLLEKDKIYRAFLKKSEEDDVYIPAAKGRSFK